MAIIRLSVIKFIELVLTVILIGLHYKSITGDRDTDFVTAGAFCGFLVILLGGFAGHIMATPINRRIDIFFCFVGAAAFIAAGVLNIQYYDDYWKGETRNYGLTKAAFAIICAVVFLIDSLFTWRGEY